eukprot:13006086-Ditylum_brightwellii.AAC.1
MLSKRAWLIAAFCSIAWKAGGAISSYIGTCFYIRVGSLAVVVVCGGTVAACFGSFEGFFLRTDSMTGMVLVVGVEEGGFFGGLSLLASA